MIVRNNSLLTSPCEIPRYNILLKSCNKLSGYHKWRYSIGQQLYLFQEAESTFDGH